MVSVSAVRSQWEAPQCPLCLWLPPGTFSHVTSEPSTLWSLHTGWSAAEPLDEPDLKNSRSCFPLVPVPSPKPTPPFTVDASHLAASISHFNQSCIQVFSASWTTVFAGSTAEAPPAMDEVSFLHDYFADTDLTYKSTSVQDPCREFFLSSVGLKTKRNELWKIKSIDWSLAPADD